MFLQRNKSRIEGLQDILVPRINPAFLSHLVIYLPHLFLLQQSCGILRQWHDRAFITTSLLSINKGKELSGHEFEKKTVGGQLEPPPVPICGRECSSVQYPAGGQLLLCPQINDRTALGVVTSLAVREYHKPDKVRGSLIQLSLFRLSSWVETTITSMGN